MEYHFASQDTQSDSFYFALKTLISGLKSYRDFGETGSWLQVVATSFVLSDRLLMKPQKNLPEQNSWRRRYALTIGINN